MISSSIPWELSISSKVRSNGQRPSGSSGLSAKDVRNHNDKDPGCYLGVLQLHFEDSARTILARCEWMDESEKSFSRFRPSIFYRDVEDIEVTPNMELEGQRVLVLHLRVERSRANVQA